MTNHIKTVEEHLRELGPLEAKRHVPGSSVPNELREFVLTQQNLLRSGR
jgi:hypothetical protein